MTKMSISEAARQAGISRQYFYSKYINTGTITVSVDDSGNKYVDESELLRVFDGRLPATKAPSTKKDSLHSPGSRHATPQNDGQITALQMEVNLLREQLHDYKQREQRLLDQVDSLAGTLKQIEYKTQSEPDQTPATPPPGRGWWSRIFRRSPA